MHASIVFRRSEERTHIRWLYIFSEILVVVRGAGGLQGAQGLVAEHYAEADEPVRVGGSLVVVELFDHATENVCAGLVQRAGLALIDELARV